MSDLCEVCETELVAGRCGVCGWENEWRARLTMLERQRRVKVRRSHGPRVVWQTREQKESPFTSSPGRGYRCPVCDGKGWTTNACDSCYLCLGRGRVSAFVAARVKR